MIVQIFLREDNCQNYHPAREVHEERRRAPATGSFGLHL
jgi:hypothetical protein